MLELRLVKDSAVHPSTMDVRWSHPAVAGWLCATQHWAWEGGDAVCVVTGSGHNVRTYCVIRVGTDVRVVEANGLTFAMDAIGLDSTKFKVV